MVLFTTRAEILPLLGISVSPDLFVFELIDVVIMSLALGYIFKDMFRISAPQEQYDPLKELQAGILNQQNFKFAVMAVGPAVVLHEFGHKLTAMAFGIPATFYAAYGMLLLGVVLRMINFPFIFFIPGFVSHGPAPPLESAIIAFAGPAVHGILWLLCRFALSKKLFDKKYTPVLIMARYINGFLFILNMLPLPGVDGFQVYSGLWQYFFGA